MVDDAFELAGFGVGSATALLGASALGVEGREGEEASSTSIESGRPRLLFLDDVSRKVGTAPFP